MAMSCNNKPDPENIDVLRKNYKLVQELKKTFSKRR